MWEPILNETPYPRDFALEALRITWEEFPYPGRPVAAADVHSKGVAENYDVVYGWPGDDEKADRPEQCIFTREFGENVDDWYAHNNNTVPAVAGGNARCWCRRCHYQRVMMKCTALQGSLSVGRNGILLTISGGIIRSVFRGHL